VVDDYVSKPLNRCELLARINAVLRRDDLLIVALKLNDGSWLNFATPPPPISTVWHNRFFGYGTKLAFVVVIICVWAVHRATQPLGIFAHAAERLGLDFNARSLDETGSDEV